MGKNWDEMFSFLRCNTYKIYYCVMGKYVRLYGWFVISMITSINWKCAASHKRRLNVFMLNSSWSKYTVTPKSSDYITQNKHYVLSVNAEKKSLLMKLN